MTSKNNAYLSNLILEWIKLEFKIISNVKIIDNSYDNSIKFSYFNTFCTNIQSLQLNLTKFLFLSHARRFKKSRNPSVSYS